jgi:purine-nucleoside phosphorylase
MEDSAIKMREAAEFIKSKMGENFDCAIVLGSGLGPLVDHIEEKKELFYQDIPNFPKTTVLGHDGKLVCGKIDGKKILAMKGRFHFYEGHDIQVVAFPVRVFKMMGIEKLIVTNAAGGVHRGFKPGDLMVITDHIGLFAPSVLRGSNLEELGTRFPDMSEIYSKKLIKLTKEIAESIGVNLQFGVYMFTKGPNFESPAEIKVAETLGADAVGMSTVPESIAAKHAGMEILGISCITNMASGILDQPLSHEEVFETAKIASERFTNLVSEIVKKI